MSRIKPIIEELDKLAPGLLDCSLDFSLRPGMPTMKDLDHLRSFVPNDHKQRVYALLMQYQALVHIGRSEDAWEIARRFAKTEEETELLNELERMEKNISDLAEAQQANLRLQALYTETVGRESVVGLLKGQYASTERAIEHLVKQHGHLVAMLKDVVALSRAVTVGNA